VTHTQTSTSALSASQAASTTPVAHPGGLQFSKPGQPLRVLIVTDAWEPQVNGVVRTLQQLGTELGKMGHQVRYVTPLDFKTIPAPTYPEIRLALWPLRWMAKVVREFAPCAIHIATEGPLGLAARNYCVRKGLPFSTSFHTRFPEYINARFGTPVAWGYRFLRWFHGPATTMMVATRSLQEEMVERAFPSTAIWSRGVDTDLYKPRPDLKASNFLNLPRPLWLYVGRVAVEKNIESFLKLDLPGTKLVVGGGPQLESLRQKYSDVQFVGPKFGEELAEHYAASDCFVFPSKTDTFGLVTLEALASGTPVAAYPVQGPKDVIGDAPVGCLRDDLRSAALTAVKISPDRARAFALGYSWEACTNQFISNLAIQRQPGVEGSRPRLLRR
jgi:glycosyltransferase involved in cell wall biosynthesis